MIIAVMDALKIDRADLVSNDSGTTVAQLLAVRHPARVRSMLMTNGDVHTNSPPEPLKPAIEAARQGLLINMFDKQFTLSWLGSRGGQLGKRRLHCSGRGSGGRRNGTSLGSRSKKKRWRPD